jgi:alkanesulfonate monooxygenase SsuD/methylene tetrahydromethanopterin reductase-like flavin-dependent oxidoreductase (luciferase family)
MLSGQMIGTPDHVARKLARFRDEYSCTHFIMASQLPRIDSGVVTRSFDLFARGVMPSFRG